MQKLSPLSFLPLLFIFLCSCEKKDPYKEPEKLELPPITMEGNGTFGCKVNGEIWVPFVENVGLFNSPLEISNDVGTIRISARLQKDKNKIDEKVAFQIFGDTIGTYILDYPRAHFTNFKNSKSSCIGYDIGLESSKILIHYNDFGKRIISGEFELTKLINECADTVNITEGRFDLKY